MSFQKEALASKTVLADLTEVVSKPFFIPRPKEKRTEILNTAVLTAFLRRLSVLKRAAPNHLTDKSHVIQMHHQTILTKECSFGFPLPTKSRSSTPVTTQKHWIGSSALIDLVQ